MVFVIWYPLRFPRFPDMYHNMSKIVLPEYHFFQIASGKYSLCDRNMTVLVAGSFGTVGRVVTKQLGKDVVVFYYRRSSDKITFEKHMEYRGEPSGETTMPRQYQPKRKTTTLKSLYEEAKITHCFKVRPSMEVLLDNWFQVLSVGSLGLTNSILRTDREDLNVTCLYYERNDEGFFEHGNKFNVLSDDPSKKTRH